MLVLSRKKNEAVVIGHHGEIVVTLIEVRGDKCRIGIEAAKDTPVHRREVYDAIVRNGGQSGDGKKPGKDAA